MVKVLLKLIALGSTLEREVTEAKAQELVTRHCPENMEMREVGAHKVKYVCFIPPRDRGTGLGKVIIPFEVDPPPRYPNQLEGTLPHPLTQLRRLH